MGRRCYFVSSRSQPLCAGSVHFLQNHNLILCHSCSVPWQREAMVFGWQCDFPVLLDIVPLHSPYPHEWFKFCRSEGGSETI